MNFLCKSDSFVWQGVERLFNAFVLFVLGVVVARMIGPEEYGLVSLIMVLIAFSDLAVNCGLGMALIQKDCLEKEDIYLVLTIATVFSVVMAFFLVGLAPFISNFYGDIRLRWMIYIYTLGIWPFSIYGILRSLYMKMLDFKSICIVSVFSLGISCACGVIMAVFDMGLYSMVIQAVVGAVIGCFVLWQKAGLRAHFSWNFARGIEFINYGYKFIVSNIIDTAYKGAPTAVIPVVYGSDILSFFSYGRQIPNVIVSTASTALASYMFPQFAEKQFDLKSLKMLVRKSINMYMFFMCPIIMAVSALSENIIVIVLGKDWLDASFFLSILSLVYLLYSLQTMNFQAIAALGDSGVLLRYEIFKKCVGIVCLGVAVFFDVATFVYIQLIVAMIFFLIGMYPSCKYLAYSVYEQIRDLYRSVVCSATMCTVLYFSKRVFCHNGSVSDLLALCLIGVVSYGIGSALFNKSAFYDVVMLCYGRGTSQGE